MVTLILLMQRQSADSTEQMPVEMHIGAGLLLMPLTSRLKILYLESGSYSCACNSVIVSSVMNRSNTFITAAAVVPRPCI